MRQTILLVGGGTGGHIFPLYPLAKGLLRLGHEVHLIVNDAPIDRQVIADKFHDLPDLKVHYLKTHKIDYHLSFRNLVAPFKIVASFFRTKKLLKKLTPDSVFFKGGFVGFPVLVALKYLGRYRGKIYLHDSDISAGALTRFIGKSADHIFSNFGSDATPLFYWPESINLTKKVDKPKKILVFGGSQGAQFLNTLIIQNTGNLPPEFEIDLVTGPRNKITAAPPNVLVHDFLPQAELIERVILADLVICRSGASLFQVLAAQTKCIAVPLPSSARNHQHQNAKYFADKGLCYLLEQNNQTASKLSATIESILKDQSLATKLSQYDGQPQTEKIIKTITTPA